MVSAAIRDALLLAALAPFGFCLFAIFAARKFFRSGADSEGPLVTAFPPVSILRPIYGLDREAYENFASFCRQDYPEFEMLFCVCDENDPAFPVIQKLIADFPQQRIRLLVGSQPLGASDKINKLCRMANEARHDVLIVCDSDVRVEPGFLRAIAASFADPPFADTPSAGPPSAGTEIGGVTCLYRGLTDGSLAARLEAIGNSTDFAAGVLVARALSGVDFMLGAVMATTKARLAEIGGFESLVNHFSDDYELGNRIARAGHRVQLSRFPVSIVYPHGNFAGAFRQQTRWYASVKHSRLWGHVGLIFSQPLPWTILAAVIAPDLWMSFAYVGVYLLLRVWSAWAVGVSGMHDDLVRRNLWLLPLRDLFALASWIASFFPRRINWRGQQFYVRNRQLVRVPTRNATPR
ncbi:MAG TPA: bacteriohopanetetrol glucosamine biosynthesis glycosyltransferase HpnI [Candidatus Acidoferrales bacterium]|nr:bacteriohopanetetrol glucosamine biosynthesis glycosyltransferase HpnI [Candidatus Acidoferrales bacterium]